VVAMSDYLTVFVSRREQLSRLREKLSDKIFDIFATASFNQVSFKLSCNTDDKYEFHYLHMFTFPRFWECNLVYDFDKCLPQFAQFVKVTNETGTKKPNKEKQEELVKLKLNKIVFK
jgi:hypothetical protein